MGNTFCKSDVTEHSPIKLEAGQLIQEIIPECDKFTQVDDLDKVGLYNDKYNLIITRSNTLIVECNQKPYKYYDSIKIINQLINQLYECLQNENFDNFDKLYNELSTELDKFRIELDSAETENTYVYQFIINNDVYDITLLMIDAYRSVVKVIVDGKKYVSRIRHAVCYTNPTMSNLVITETVNNLIKVNLDKQNVKFEKNNDHIKIIMNNSISNVNTKFEYTVKCYIE
jgi:hypothetical protein